MTLEEEISVEKVLSETEKCNACTKLVRETLKHVENDEDAYKKYLLTLKDALSTATQDTVFIKNSGNLTKKSDGNSGAKLQSSSVATDTTKKSKRCRAAYKNVI